MLLLSIIVLPLLAALLLALLGGDRGVARWIALLTAVGTLALSVGLFSRIHSHGSGIELVQNQSLADSPVRPRVEWRRTWMTLGEQQASSTPIK